ncbi:hypothetical protein [Gemmatimonas sp.]|uniref:hypothetical protein n=2 Tax=Gemmatimonas sp. TaxID=1962908 RepID=UPI003DA290C5
MPFPSMCPLAVRRLVAVTALALLPQVAGAQTTSPAAPTAASSTATDTAQAAAARVFVDCQSSNCDFDFFRDQMRWVNFVRDRLFSDVLLLVTSLRTGAGGIEYTIAAIGNDKYKGRADTAVVVAAPNDAQDVVRRSLARTFSLLLAPYAAKSPLASRIDLTYRAPVGATTNPKSVKDPWNFWVYRISANGFGSGEKRQQFMSGFLNASANRVTAAWKVNVGANLGYDESRFTLSNGSTFTNLLRNYGGNTLVARSIGNHFAVGANVSGSYSDFSNYRLNLRVMPALEWNLFDYKDFTRRQLTTYYALGVGSYQYKQPTIYDRYSETRPLHSLTVAWNARQPWGSVNWSLFGSQYLHNTRFNSYGTSGFIDLRIAKGLSINVGGNYSRVNDQLYLPRGTLNDNEIIARQQALATNYRFFLNFGMSYTFGSIYNTIVNPRFGGTRGGGQMVMSF